MIPLTVRQTELPTVDLRVWLVDLTYTQLGVSAETIPQAVGGLATHAATRMQLTKPVRVFKYPERLAAALRAEGPPDVIGFSNYVWNSNLSLAFATQIKRRAPETVVIFGGPHYPTIPQEQERFLRHRLGPAVDFYIDREGEAAFAALLLALAKHRREDLNGHLAGVHSIDGEGHAHLPPPGPRLLDLSEVPSPYLAGLMDEFFDGQLVPTVQTNRGCPFTCTFCVEGSRYHQKVAKKAAERITAELRYIAQRMVLLLADGRGRNELLITDSNFGMYPDDLNTCRAIAECQEQYGWPKYVSVTTGKNRRDRVLEAVSLVNGAMVLSGAVQSLDPDVLANVKRTNIDADAIMDIALTAATQAGGAYSEVILGLPGDSKDRHFRTLRTLLDTGFVRLNMFQLSLLPGSDLCSETSRAQHQMVTQWRVMPRCIGQYEVLGDTIRAVEVDEVCVGGPDLPYGDYRECRLMNLLVATFINDGAFAALVQGLRATQVPVFDWLATIHTDLLARIGQPDPDSFTALVAAFLADTDRQLWADRVPLQDHAASTIDDYLSGADGANLLYTYRARALTETLDDTCRLAHAGWTATVAKATGEPLMTEFAIEATEYHRLRMVEVFTPRAAIGRQQPAQFDLDTLIAATTPSQLSTYLLVSPETRHFALTDEQIQTVAGYLTKFGNDPRGAGRMLTKVRMTDLLRRPHPATTCGQPGIVCDIARTRS